MIWYHNLISAKASEKCFQHAKKHQHRVSEWFLEAGVNFCLYGQSYIKQLF